MGRFFEILCANCNFKIIIGGYDNFYIDHKSNELVEYMPLMLSEIDRKNEIFGYIEQTYCPGCDKLIKSYIITESKLSKDESISKLEEIIEKTDINEKRNIELLLYFQQEPKVDAILGRKDFDEDINNDFLQRFESNENVLTLVEFKEALNRSDFESMDEYIEYDYGMNAKINCPECKRELYREFKGDECPICGNELEYGCGANIG